METCSSCCVLSSRCSSCGAVSRGKTYLRVCGERVLAVRERVEDSNQHEDLVAFSTSVQKAFAASKPQRHMLALSRTSCTPDDSTKTKKKLRERKKNAKSPSFARLRRGRGRGALASDIERLECLRERAETGHHQSSLSSGCRPACKHSQQTYEEHTPARDKIEGLGYTDGPR